MENDQFEDIHYRAQLNRGDKQKFKASISKYPDSDGRMGELLKLSLELQIYRPEIPAQDQTLIIPKESSRHAEQDLRRVESE